LPLYPSNLPASTPWSTCFEHGFREFHPHFYL
jgi:hypothetical protein